MKIKTLQLKPSPRPRPPFLSSRSHKTKVSRLDLWLDHDNVQQPPRWVLLLIADWWRHYWPRVNSRRRWAVPATVRRATSSSSEQETSWSAQSHSVDWTSSRRSSRRSTETQSTIQPLSVSTQTTRLNKHTNIHNWEMQLLQVYNLA